MASSSPTFLGLDLSTQQLKAILISEDSTVLHESSVHFDRDLSHYGTSNGALVGSSNGPIPAEEHSVTSPVAMWLDALDLLFTRIKSSNKVDFKAIVAISGAAQQHGSVYWTDEAHSLLAALDSTKTLRNQLAADAFSLPNGPIWQDSSTTRECREFEDAVGGPQSLADITGSRAYERFTGPQISRIRRLAPDVYAQTSRISLVSSFLASLFLGFIAPIEASDASGMNLTELATNTWYEPLLQHCGGTDLRSKLGPEPVFGGQTLGTIHGFWIKKWGFSPDCIIAPFTGDNPGTVASFSSGGHEDALLSLGTSTTLLLTIPPSSSQTDLPRRFTTSHLLAHPTTRGAHIAMLCYKNGALAREQVRDSINAELELSSNTLEWSAFNDAVAISKPGNSGFIGLYFPLREIIPDGVTGTHFFIANGEQVRRVDTIPIEAQPRAILESQLLSIRSRIDAILPESSSTHTAAPRLILTGGASSNTAIQQIAADVLGMRAFVDASGTSGSAGLGGAFLAMLAWKKGRGENETQIEEGSDANKASLALHCVAEPAGADVEAKYAQLVPVYRKCEDVVVEA